MSTTIQNDSTEQRLRGGAIVCWRWAVLLWLVSALLLAAINQYRNGPATLADELGYLGIARWLAGAGPLPNMFTAAFYHFGYSFLIAPAFWLASNPVDAYKWVMVINCILAATVAPLSYVFARRIFSVPNSKAVLLAVVAMLYPANAVQTNFAWSENVLPALLLCWTILLMAAHERPTPTRLVLLALVPVALFFAHPRMLGIELVTLAYLLAAAALTRKPNRWWYLISCSVLILAHALVAHELTQVRHLAYESSHGTVTNFLHVLRHVFSQGMRLPAAASGQITYLSYGSEGLIVIGVIALIWLSVQRYRNLRTEHSIVFSTLMNPNVILAAGIASIFAASAITMAGGARVDHWLYGRYVDVASPILLITGTLAVLDRRQIRIFAPWSVMILCFAVTLWFTYAAITIPNGVVYNNIPTLAPLIHALQSFAGAKHIPFAVIMLLVLAPVLLWAAVGRRAAVPVIAVYLLISIITIVEWPRYLVGHNAYPEPVKEMRAELTQMNLSDSEILVYRDAFSEPAFVAMFYRMQYFLDKNRFVVVDHPASQTCPRVGTAKDRGGATPRQAPIPLANGVTFWVPLDVSGASPCR